MKTYNIAHFPLSPPHAKGHFTLHEIHKNSISRSRSRIAYVRVYCVGEPKRVYATARKSCVTRPAQSHTRVHLRRARWGVRRVSQTMRGARQRGGRRAPRTLALPSAALGTCRRTLETVAAPPPGKSVPPSGRYHFPDERVGSKVSDILTETSSSCPTLPSGLHYRPPAPLPISASFSPR